MINVEKICIGIIFGGNSNEHEISISSAQTIFKAFDSKINKKRFIVKAFYITKEGEWLNNKQSIKVLLNENLKENTHKNQID